ncbi:MAG: ferredoxin family protein [Desulfohalobiaceae bacterium]|nr:ferredoxin family protein [Desulfohalobiaceae bacterium]
MPPVIDPEKCTKCGICVDICSEDVFYESKQGEIPTVTYPEECIHFAGCVYNCPSEAIRLRIPLPMQLVYKPSEDIELPWD